MTDSEAIAVLLRRQGRVIAEQAAEGARIRITDLLDDSIDRHVAGLEQGLGALDAKALNVGTRAFSRRPSETTRQAPPADRDPRREIVEGEPLVQVVPDPVDGPQDRRILVQCCLPPFIRNARGTPVIEQQVFGAEPGYLGTDESIHEIEHEIQSAEDAANADDAVLLDEDCIQIQLDIGGRMLVPLTVDSKLQNIGFGMMLLVTRRESHWEARFTIPVGIFHCIGARNEEANKELMDAFARGGSESVTALRRDGHDRTEKCWLHGQGYCLSA